MPSVQINTTPEGKYQRREMTLDFLADQMHNWSTDLKCKVLGLPYFLTMEPAEFFYTFLTYFKQNSTCVSSVLYIKQSKLALLYATDGSVSL